MLSSTSSPSVAFQAARQIRRSLRAPPERGLTYYAAHPNELEQRLTELNDEWDVERILEAGRAAGTLLGLAMGYLRSPRWFLLPLAMNEFVLQHLLRGHLPRLPLLGRLSFRTRKEIAHERRALEALRSAARIDPVRAAKAGEFVVRPWTHREPAAVASVKISA